MPTSQPKLGSRYQPRTHFHAEVEIAAKQGAGYPKTSDHSGFSSRILTPRPLVAVVVGALALNHLGVEVGLSMPALFGTLRLPADLPADFLLEVEVGVVDCMAGACGASARSLPTFLVPVTGAEVPVVVAGAVWA